MTESKHLRKQESLTPIQRPALSAAVVASESSIALSDSVERVVLRLNDICRRTTFAFSLAVGRLIIDEFYGGCLDRWRSRDPRKDISLRKLVRHPNVPMSAVALYRCIAIYELTERLGIKTWRHVCTSHLRLVLPCPLDEQARLLRAAEASRWSVSELNQRVALVMATHPRSRSKGGRKRITELMRTLHTIERCTAALDTALNGNVDDVQMSVDSARDAVTALQQHIRSCKKLERRLRAAIPGGASVPPPPLCDESPDSDAVGR
jgi:hypothetical protein